MYHSRISKPLSEGNCKVPSVPQAVRGVLRSPGRPLDTASQAYFEPRFRHDFSHVRVHTDSGAARSASVIDAQAYTSDNHIVFAEGTYAPGSTASRRLMAHELAHVVQQERGGPVVPVAGDPSLEAAAEQAADGVARNGRVTVAGSAGIGIARQPQSSSTAAGAQDIDPQEQRQKDILVLLGLGVSLDKLIDYFRIPRGDFMSKYGFWEYFRFRRIVAKIPIDVLARMIPHGDQTEYLQASGRIATDAEEKATQLRNFDPGTPLGGVAYAGARALGASHETAKLSQAFGDLANAGLAAPGSASQGAAPPTKETQWGAPLAPPPEHVAAMEPRATTPAAQPVAPAPVAEAIPAPPAPAPAAEVAPAPLAPAPAAEVAPAPLAPAPAAEVTPAPPAPAPGSGYATAVGELKEPAVLRLIPGARSVPPKFPGYDGFSGGTTAETLLRAGQNTVVQQSVKDANWISIISPEAATAERVQAAVSTKLLAAYNAENNPSLRTAPADPADIGPSTRFRVVKDGPAKSVTIMVNVPGPVEPVAMATLQQAADAVVAESNNAAALPNLTVRVVSVK